MCDFKSSTLVWEVCLARDNRIGFPVMRLDGYWWCCKQCSSVHKHLRTYYSGFTVLLHVFYLTTGLHQTYKFSGSTSVSDVHGEASSTESVFLDTKHTCTLGQLRYIDNDPTVQKDVSDEFFEDVQSLPIRLFGLTAQDSNKYFAFFDKWGTVSVVGIL